METKSEIHERCHSCGAQAIFRGSREEVNAADAEFLRLHDDREHQEAHRKR